MFVTNFREQTNCSSETNDKCYCIILLLYNFCKSIKLVVENWLLTHGFVRKSNTDWPTLLKYTDISNSSELKMIHKSFIIPWKPPNKTLLWKIARLSVTNVSMYLR